MLKSTVIIHINEQLPAAPPHRELQIVQFNDPGQIYHENNRVRHTILCL